MGGIAMGHLRKIVVALAAVAALAAGSAQAAMGPDDGGRHHGGWNGCDCGKHGGDCGKKERFAKALGLTDKQKEQMKAVREKYRPALEPLRKEAFAERRALRALVMAQPQDEAAIRAQAAKIAGTAGDIAVQRARMFREMHAILTPEQVKKLDELKGRWEKRHEGRPDRGGPGKEEKTP